MNITAAAREPHFNFYFFFSFGFYEGRTCGYCRTGYHTRIYTKRENVVKALVKDLPGQQFSGTAKRGVAGKLVSQVVA